MERLCWYSGTYGESKLHAVPAHATVARGECRALFPCAPLLVRPVPSCVAKQRAWAVAHALPGAAALHRPGLPPPAATAPRQEKRVGDEGALSSHSPFAPPAPPAGRTSTIQHWQLRDLLHCPDADSELYCVHRNRTLRYDTHSDRVSLRARQEGVFGGRAAAPQHHREVILM